MQLNFNSMKLFVTLICSATAVTYDLPLKPKKAYVEEPTSCSTVKW
jgi:hypothetical protein